MRSSLPKVLHPVCGRAMIAWPILAAREAGAGRVIAIISPDRDLTPGLPDGTETVVQPEANGTGGAMLAAGAAIRDAEEVVVLSGDHPLVTAEIISGLLQAHRAADATATVMTVEADEPGGYGRIVRDEAGDVERIVEPSSPSRSRQRSSRSGRSTPAPTASTAPPSPTPSARSRTTTRPASTTWATCCR